MHSVGNYLFTYSDLLGHGAFALVYKGYNRGLKNEPVAIKKIRKSSFSSLQSKERKEIAILSGLKHRNIVSMIDFEETGSDIFLVLEFCNLGDLNDLLIKHNIISEDLIQLIFGQVGSAISFLHSLQIIHRDLKPQNILLHSKYPDVETSESPMAIVTTSKLMLTTLIAKIGDFGFARVLSDTTMATTLCGSPLYMAPEVLLGKSYDSKVDMWSIGTIVYQCFTGFAPFIAKTPQQLKKRYEIDLKLQPILPNQASPQLNSLILGLLKRDPLTRLGYTEFSQHPFFQTFKSFPTLKTSSVGNVKLNPDKDILYSSNKVYSTSPACIDTNLSECKYMFATPHENFESSHSSVYPPHIFDGTQNLQNCLNTQKSLSCQEAENASPMTGFVLLPRCLSDGKLGNIHLPNTCPLSTTPSSFESKKSFNNVPFSSLAPINTQNEEKTNFLIPEKLVSGVDKSSTVFLPDDSNIFDISIIEQPQPIASKEYNKSNHSDSEFLKLIFSNTTNSNSFSHQITKVQCSNTFPTMFLHTCNEDSVKLYDFRQVPLELEDLYCPYEPSHPNITEFDIFAEGKYSIYSNLYFQNSPLFLNGENLIDSNSIDLCESEKIVLKDLLIIDQPLPPIYQTKPFQSNVGSEYRLAEQYSRTILQCRYIFDTINFIKHPFFLSSLENFSFRSICNKPASFCDIKILVLLVKIVKIISNILEPNESISAFRDNSSIYEQSMLVKYKQVLVKILVKSKIELDKFNPSYLLSQTKSDCYYHNINSAESLIYKHIVEICQIATLEQIFDKSDRDSAEKYMKANHLAVHLSQTSHGSSFLNLNQFCSFSKEAVCNIQTMH